MFYDDGYYCYKCHLINNLKSIDDERFVCEKCMIEVGDILECVIDGSGEGYAIYAGEHYIAATDQYEHDGKIMVELKENGDSEPYMIYETKYFEVI